MIKEKPIKDFTELEFISFMQEISSNKVGEIFFTPTKILLEGKWITLQK